MKKILNILLITGLFFITSCEKENLKMDEDSIYVIDVVNLTSKPMYIQIGGEVVDTLPYIIYGDSVDLRVSHNNVLATSTDTIELSRFKVYINGELADSTDCKCISAWNWYSGNPF